MDELEKLVQRWWQISLESGEEPEARFVYALCAKDLSALGQTHALISREPSEAELDRLIAAIRRGILGELACSSLSNEEIRGQWEPIARAAYKAITEGRNTKEAGDEG